MDYQVMSYEQQQQQQTGAASSSTDTGYYRSSSSEESVSVAYASPFTSEDESGSSAYTTSSSSKIYEDDDEDDDDVTVPDSKPVATVASQRVSSGSCSLLSLGSDVMASVVAFLEPTETLQLLTFPLCREWRESYTAHQGLWRVLCCEEPFAATLAKERNTGYVSSSDEDDSCADSQNVVDDDEDSFCSLDGDVAKDQADNDVLGEYRLLYTSFVRCMKYLQRIQEDARNGRPPSAIDFGNEYRRFPTFGVTKSLKKFLAKRSNGSLKAVIGDGSGDISSYGAASTAAAMTTKPIGVSADGKLTSVTATPPPEDTKKPKYGKSMITDRLFGPTADGTPSHLNLPTNCAIYSIVNWMVAHPDVGGILTMCICSLPTLLEDEQQRLTAQRVGLVEVVLCAMLRFPDSAKLHTAAFHTMVLLARPIGGREGMLFDNSMADSAQSLGLNSKARYGRIISSLDRTSTQAASSDITHSSNGRNSLNGVSILIASMERFASDEKLQAMACWAMVNLALVPAQKTMLIGLNGIHAAVNAMTNHPKSFDVQFRALFALINLVVPSTAPLVLRSLRSSEIADASEEHQPTEKDVLDAWATSIARLVVEAMENFCSSETILNRACLVLHNLSQTPDYLPVLLWTPHCYQMLEWCRANHSTDIVLLRSASSTLGRIQAYLSQHEDERQKFVQSLQREQQEQRQQHDSNDSNAQNIVLPLR
jgi:hypothetical protein